jgi:hypothetical protein
VGRRRREDVGEVGDEEQRREADEEELHAVHGCCTSAFAFASPDSARRSFSGDWRSRWKAIARRPGGLR